MNIANYVRMFAVLIVLGCWTTNASAQSLEHVEQQIELDREARPEIYAAVETVRLQAVWFDQHKRGRLAVMGPAFSALGPDATLAVVDALLEDAPLQAPPTARQAWRVGMLNALRDWRDPVARPALEVMLSNGEKDPVIARATAEALAMLLDDEAADFLMRQIQGEDPVSLAIAGGLSMCRRARVAQFLSTQLATATSAEAHAAYLEAVGDVANSWAWETDVVAASGESVETRTIARDALLRVYMQTDGRTAKEAVKGILLADAPQTVEVVTAMRDAAGGAELAKLEWLLKRVESNPLHRRR